MEFEVMSVWRKALMAIGLLTFFWLGSPAFLDQVTIYNNAPKTPSPATSQTCAVIVMHGSVRYVSEQERSHMAQSRTMAGWVGLPMLIVAIVPFLPRRAKRQIC
jgi:hypothetical protein